MVREIAQKSHNFILYFSNPFVSGYVFDYQTDIKEKAAKLAALSVELPLLGSNQGLSD